MRKLKRIELVVCDMDGTLLNSRKEYSSRTAEAVKTATKNGIYVTICSGRVYTMLESYWRGLGIEGPIIAANGAHIVDTSSGKTLWEATVDPEEAVQLMDYCRSEGMDYAALCEDNCYFSPISLRKERFVQYNSIAAAAGFNPIPMLSLERQEDNQMVLGKKIHKLLVYELKSGDVEKAQRFIAANTTMDCTSSEEGLLDIAAGGVSKGAGLIRLAELMAIPLENVCAIGDYDNDVPMFEAAGYAVAMANASDAAKAKADQITCSNDEDGVAAVLEQFLLERKIRI